MPETALVESPRAAMIKTLERTDATIDCIRDLTPALASRLSGYAEATKRVLASLRDPASADHDCLEAARAHLAELLGLCVAAMARKAGLDDGLTEIAEAWLDGLSTKANLPHVAIVIPADDEFTDMAAQVIKLRMPLEGIWGLTVAAHEYGHFLASTLTRRAGDVDGLPQDVLPVEAKLRSCGLERPKLYRRGHELFADSVAVAIAGPAFSHHCVRYRFDVTSENGATDTHPSFARRMHLQLDLLSRMAKEDGDAWLAAAATTIGARWQGLAAAAGTNGAVEDDEDLDSLGEFCTHFVLTDRTLGTLRYRNHVRAVQLATGNLDSRGQHYSIAHVLNAAWSARLRLEAGIAGTLRDLAAVEVAARSQLERAVSHG